MLDAPLSDSYSGYWAIWEPGTSGVGDQGSAAPQAATFVALFPATLAGVVHCFLAPICQGKPCACVLFLWKSGSRLGGRSAQRSGANLL